MLPWEELPSHLKNDAVRPYYVFLKKRRKSLVLKRIFDLIFSLVLLVVLSPIFLILSLIIIADSKGGVFYRQERVTQYGRKFYIHKFRTMVQNADTIGTQVTLKDDMRVTKVGKLLRRSRLDEIPQLIDVLFGDMSFVGTRPEVPKYVEMYSDEMYATLLLRAGITSEASIRYKDENELLKETHNIDRIYIEQILPEKMQYNLEAIMKFSFIEDVKTMVRTVTAVLK